MAGMNATPSPISSTADVDTLLAAMAHYKASGFGDPANRPEQIHEIAAARDISLDDAGIDSLMARLRALPVRSKSGTGDGAERSARFSLNALDRAVSCE